MKGYDKNTKQIFNGVAWLGLSAIILKLIGLVYKIPMSYLLGDEGMGYFNSAYTVYTFFYIIGSAGIPKAISILSAKSTPGEAKRIFSVIFRIYAVIGIILSVSLLCMSKFLASIIGSENSALTILAIAPSVVFVCCSGVLRGYLNGKTKFVPIAISELISGICKLLLGLVFAVFSIKNNFSLSAVCAFSILGITIGSFFGFIYLYIYYKRESENIKKEYIPQKTIIKDVFKIGLPIAFAAALSNIVNVIDLSIIMNRLIKSGYSETVSAAIYGNYTTLAVPIFSLVTNLLNTVTLASLPIMTKCFSERKYTELELSLNSSLKLSLFIAVPACFLFLFFSYEILSVIFEIGSATLGTSFLFFLAPGVIFYSLLMMSNTVLEAEGRIKTAVFSLSVGALVKILLSIILIGNNNFEALGAPIGTSISYAVSFFISICAINKNKNFKMPIFNSLINTVIISILSLIPTLLFKSTIQISQNIRINSLIILIIYAVFYLTFSSFSTIKTKKREKLSAKCTKN